MVSDLASLPSLIDRFDIDIVHSHHAWVDGTVIDLLADSDCEIVVTLHGMYETIDDYRLKAVLPRLIEHASAIVNVADKNLDAIRRHKLIENVSPVFIENALGCPEFDVVSRDSLAIDETAFVLVLVSRAIPEKGMARGIGNC